MRTFGHMQGNNHRLMTFYRVNEGKEACAIIFDKVFCFLPVVAVSRKIAMAAVSSMA